MSERNSPEHLFALGAVSLPQGRQNLGDQAGREEGLRDRVVQVARQPAPFAQCCDLLRSRIKLGILDHDRSLIGQGLYHDQVAVVESI